MYLTLESLHAALYLANETYCELEEALPDALCPTFEEVLQWTEYLGAKGAIPLP